jgi:hypothetical protein
MSVIFSLYYVLLIELQEHVKFTQDAMLRIEDKVATGFQVCLAS